MIDFISDHDCDCLISWHYSVNAAEHQRKLLEVDLFKTWEGRDIIGLQRMTMVRKKSKYIFLVFYNGPDKCIYISLVFLVSVS